MENIWAEERKARLEAQTAFVREVARELGLEVREYDPGEYYERVPDIVTPEGALIEVGEISRKRRQIYPHGWPKERRMRDVAGAPSNQLVPRDIGEVNPDISVSGEKTAAQVARDIQRRVLPEVARIYAKLAEKARDNDARVEKAQEVYRRLCEVLKKPVALDNYPDRLVTSLLYSAPKVYGEVTVGYGGSVDIHARGLTPELAEKLVRALKGEENA